MRVERLGAGAVARGLTLTLAVLAISLVTACSPDVEVPDLDSMYLSDARAAVAEAELSVGEVRREDGSSVQFDYELVVGQDPPAGTLAQPGTPVNLLIAAPDEDVPVPDLVGRFRQEAQQLAWDSGLIVTDPDEVADYPFVNPFDSIQPAEFEIVFSQEPTAGTVVPFGSTVTVSSSFPHTPEISLSREAFQIHGLMYLRYGFDGMGLCNACHTPATCVGSNCHTGGAISRLADAPELEQLAPDASSVEP